MTAKASINWFEKVRTIWSQTSVLHHVCCSVVSKAQDIKFFLFAFGRHDSVRDWEDAFM